MKTSRTLHAHALSLTTLLALACGSSSTESTGGSQSSSSGTDATATGVMPTSTTGSTEANSATEAVTGVSMSASGTEATSSTAGTLTEGITSTDSATDTSTTGPATSETTSSTTATSNTTTGTTATSDTTDSDTTGEPGSTTDDTADDTTTGETPDTTTGEAVSCGTQLKATIRDFKVGHPDFQTYCCKLVKNLVKPDLGADKKPVFNQIGTPQMLTDAPTFNQWYNDVPDINKSTQITLDLQEIMPGVYSYQSNSFFPIDNMLFGNDGNGHNFHFTTEIHTFFTYTGGETFTFTGDDDVWVFINKKLVIDLGGVHPNTDGSVALDSLGLSMGDIYTLDVFHAERHVVQSNFRIDTTICAIPQ